MSNFWSNSKSKTDSPASVTESGKSASSKNARKHGCCAVDASLLPTESIEDFKALEQTWLKAYSPQNEAERHLVADLVNADWLLQRTTQTVLDIEAKLYAENPNPLDWSEASQRTLGRFLRYKTANANTVIRCRKAIEDYRKSRANEKLSAEKLNLAQERTKAAAQKKDTPIVDWQQHLRNMRAEAVARGFVSPDEPNPFDNR